MIQWMAQHHELGWQISAIISTLVVIFQMILLARCSKAFTEVQLIIKRLQAEPCQTETTRCKREPDQGCPGQSSCRNCKKNKTE